jgi:hypothetical protein
VGTRPGTADQPDLATLLSTIAHDAKQLLHEQIALFKAEVGQELRRAGGAAAAVSAGGALVAAGGLLSGFTLAHVLHRAFGLPLWASFGLVSGGLGVAGVALLRSGRDGVAGLRPLPQTTEALGENLAWLSDQLNPMTG